jgi:hypothetical protein
MRSVIAGSEPCWLFASKLVADFPQEVLAPPDLALVFDSLRGEAIHDAEDATALLGFGQNDLRRVVSAELGACERAIPRGILCSSAFPEA